jgi:hypothetical protein
VSAGIMTPDAGNTFSPTRPISGSEAVAAIEKLEAVLSRP